MKTHPTTTILISAIGRGQKDQTSRTYQRTTYRYGEVDVGVTPFFFDAVRRVESPGAIHLIGTATSSWGALVDAFLPDDLDLFTRIEDRTEGRDAPGVTAELLLALSGRLSGQWGIEVTCTALCHREISDADADRIVAQVLQLLPLDSDSELLLDLTHGFRTLPMLAFSAVQIAEGFRPGFFARTRLVYGELTQFPAQAAQPAKDGPAIGVGKGYSFRSIQRLAAVAHAAATFEDTLDASSLAEAVRAEAPQLAEALVAFSLAIEANAFDRLGERISQVRNALRPALPPASDKAWWPLLSQRLERLVKSLDHPTLAKRLLALAQLRADRNHFGPAILALAEAASALACPQQVKEYDDMKTAGELFCSRLERADQDAWRQLFQLRNRVAHGANLVDQRGMLQVQSLGDRYRKAASAVQRWVRA